MSNSERYTAHVIASRARTMHGKKLTDSDFNALLSCRTVSDVATYLKNETAYREVLADISETTVHRGFLEMQLRRRLWDVYESLARFVSSKDRRLFGYLMQREEVNGLIRLLRLINANRAEDYVFSLPPLFADQSDIPMVAVNRAQNMAQLVTALRPSVYGDLLMPFSAFENGTLPLGEIENILYRHVTETLLSFIRQTTGELHHELTNLCGIRIDAQNVTRIYRLKRFFGASPEEIRKQLLPKGGAISDKIWNRLLYAEVDEVTDIFFSTPFGRRMPPDQRRYTFDLPERANYYTAKHYLHYSVHPVVVLLSYLTIAETEIMDVINIIEGIRYRLPLDEIKPTLILY